MFGQSHVWKAFEDTLTRIRVCDCSWAARRINDLHWVAMRHRPCPNWRDDFSSMDSEGKIWLIWLKSSGNKSRTSLQAESVIGNRSWWNVWAHPWTYYHAAESRRLWDDHYVSLNYCAISRNSCPEPHDLVANTIRTRAVTSDLSGNSNNTLVSDQPWLENMRRGWATVKCQTSY